MCNHIIKCAVTEGERKAAMIAMQAAIRDKSVAGYAMARVALDGPCNRAASQDA